jgi:hypothetical protein
LKSPADVSDLTYALTWGTGGEPKFMPTLSESFDDIIAKAKSLVSPPHRRRNIKPFDRAAPAPVLADAYRKEEITCVNQLLECSSARQRFSPCQRRSPPSKFKFVVMPTDLKVVQAPNIDGQVLSAGKYFGVAFFKDGRVAVKDFVSAGDLKNGLGPVRGYSTYTFEDGSSITASYIGEFKATGAHGDYTVLSGTGLYDKATGTGSWDAVPTKWTDGAVLLTGQFHVKTPEGMAAK